MAYRGVSLHPPELRDLQREIRNHPELVEILKKQPDFAEWIAAVATYCNVLLDGYYEVAQLADLCNTLTNKLYKKRSQLIILPN